LQALPKSSTAMPSKMANLGWLCHVNMFNLYPLFTLTSGSFPKLS
jgi:hypothetical protein